MPLFRDRSSESIPASPRPSGYVRTRSSIVPAGSAQAGLPKLWEESDEGEVTGETELIASRRRPHQDPHLVAMTGSIAGQVVALDGACLVIGRSRRANLRAVDDGVSRTHCRIVRDENGLFIEDLGSTNGTIVNGTKVTRAELIAGDRIQLGANLILQISMYDDTEQTLARKMFEASTRDPLTSAFNRHYFGQRLEAEMAHARRHSGGLSVMMLDVDALKSINDAHGRDVGDDVLREVARAMTQTIRAEDLFCRYDGGKFALLVREPVKNAARSAERLRMRIEGVRINLARRTLQVTASVGVAEIGEPGAQLTGEGLIRVAERRLYRAKLSGKNRVCSD